jgi:hypothetical protein
MASHSIISRINDEYSETSVVLRMKRQPEEDVNIYYNPRLHADPPTYTIWTDARPEFALSLFHLYISNVRDYRPEVVAIRQIGDLTKNIHGSDLNQKS